MNTENNPETLMNTAVAAIRLQVVAELKDKTPSAAPTRRPLTAKPGGQYLGIALCGLEGEHDMPASWAEERWRAPRGYSIKEPPRKVICFSPYCLKLEAKLFDQDTHELPELV
jgi:hypothetical protein